MKLHILTFASVAVCAATAAPLLAQTQVTVTSLGSPTGWHQTDTKTGSAAVVGITTAYPDKTGGSGSLEFQGFSGSDKDYEGIYFSAPQSLSSLTSLNYDWYRSSTSTVSAGLQPSLHLLIDDNGQFSDLVWEQAYNGGGDAATNQWVSVDAATGNFWRSMSGATSTNCVSLNAAGNSGAQETTTLADWLNTCYDGNEMVYGVSVGFGSGWNGTFDGAVDNVEVGFGNDAGTNYNFEPAGITTTPEPSSMALLGTGLIGLVPMIRRRRKA